MHRKANKRVRTARPKTRHFSPPPRLEPGAPTDLDLMRAIQAADPEALSQLYDRYNGILKALILRVIHNEAEADDLAFFRGMSQHENAAKTNKPLPTEKTRLEL